jgi:malonyl-CoA O-methyltransferase
MHSKRHIRRNFARRAATYDAHAQVQRRMADELVRRCGAALAQARSILEIGCGTGYLTQALRRLNPEARLLAVDLDVTLLQAARARLNRDPGASWLAADGETLSRGVFDLIISNSTFQWFTDPAATLHSYGERLNPGGCLAFTAMGPETFRELAGALAQALAGVGRDHGWVIAASQFLGETAWRDLLAQAGFAHVETNRELLEVDYPSVRDFLTSLRATGATNPAPRPFSPRLFQRLLAAYQGSFGNGSIPATYDLIWATARA